MYLPRSQTPTKRYTIPAALLAITLLVIGILARNGWLPSTDPLSGKKTGWFGFQLPENASSSWNPMAAPLPTPIPQLAKEYLYLGSHLLAVEDANANPVVPADLAVWRPSSGTWWVMGGAGSQQVTQAWGTAGDKPVPGDYDGDGKTDFSVFRPSSGQWFVLQSSDNAWAPVLTWGTANDYRAPADYDGDGRTDRAVWRAGDGIWYVVQSSSQTAVYRTFGTSGDLPAAADYDGDGRAEIAVWRNSDRKFYLLNSSNSALSVIAFTQTATEVVSGDYDGDGLADPAIRSGPLWIYRESSTGQTVSISWQQATDIAVQNDYDGDGKTDIATWRNSNGNWYIRQSASGYSLRQVQWGASGDIPVPAVYRR